MKSYTHQMEKADIHKPTFSAGRPPHIVIVGAGFAGLRAAKRLARSGADITIIDRRNYHLFQPMLYQVATASLSPGDIAVSIRSVVRKYKNVDVLYDEVIGVDLKNRFIHTYDNAQQHYDYLIVATGSEYNYFGHEGWPHFAPGLKTIDDAVRIRSDILSAFEKAETTTDKVLQKELLTFVLIGAGPTGVEMAGSITEVIREGLGDFRHIDPSVIEVILLEAGSAVVPGFPEKIRKYTLKVLERRGIRIRLNCPVTNIDSHGVYLDGEFIPTSTVIWCAGVKATPISDWLGTKATRSGTIVVKPDLSLPNFPEVFVAGDAAAVSWQGDSFLPGLAAVAKQQGDYLGTVITKRMDGAGEHEPFRYRNYGTMLTIGRWAAAADFGVIQLTGPIAWLLWGLVHIYYLIGFRNRLAVFSNWVWSIFRLRRRNWLITGLSINEYVRHMQQIVGARDKTDRYARDPADVKR